MTNFFKMIATENMDDTVRSGYGSETDTLIKNGVLCDRDIDFLNHLEVPLIDEVSLEGIVGAKIKELSDTAHGAITEIRGWVQGIESKRRYIGQSCDDLIYWLENKNKSNPGLDLDMGTLKTWMKTSETYMWRYYFILNDQMWSKAKADLKKGNMTDLETLYSVDFTNRRETARELDSISDIKGLIKAVDTYRKRCDEFFDLILERKVKIKMAPFQVMLLGLVDLRLTVKKIVNLAL